MLPGRHGRRCYKAYAILSPLKAKLTKVDSGVRPIVDFVERLEHGKLAAIAHICAGQTLGPLCSGFLSLFSSLSDNISIASRLHHDCCVKPLAVLVWV